MNSKFNPMGLRLMGLFFYILIFLFIYYNNETINSIKIKEEIIMTLKELEEMRNKELKLEFNPVKQDPFVL
jgi:hypothetical protein